MDLQVKKWNWSCADIDECNKGATDYGNSTGHCKELYECNGATNCDTAPGRCKDLDECDNGTIDGGCCKDLDECDNGATDSSRSTGSCKDLDKCHEDPVHCPAAATVLDSAPGLTRTVRRASLSTTRPLWTFKSASESLLPSR